MCVLSFVGTFAFLDGIQIVSSKTLLPQESTDLTPELLQVYVYSCSITS